MFLKYVTVKTKASFRIRNFNPSWATYPVNIYIYTQLIHIFDSFILHFHNGNKLSHTVAMIQCQYM